MARKVKMVAPGLYRKRLKSQVGAQVAQRFGPAERQLGAQGARIPGWYEQYVDTIQNAGQRSQAVTQTAVSGVGGLQQGLDSTASKSWAGQQQAMAADAAVRGAPVSSRLADVAHNAANVRGGQLAGYGALIQSQGANQQHYLADRGATAKQQGIEALQRNAGQRVELATQKGEFAAVTRQGIIQSANEAAARADAEEFKRWIQTQNLSVAQQRAAIAQHNSDVAASLGQQRVNISQQNANAHDRSVNGRGSGKDGFGNTPVQRTNRTSQFRNVVSDAAGQIAFNRKSGHAADWHSVYQSLAGDYPNVNADILIGAVQMAALGHVGPDTAQRLGRLGVDPVHYRRRAKRVLRVPGGATGYSRSGGRT